ncbi:MAG: alkane 1-monooxygenase [Bacteroidia bacterium]
MKRQWSYAFCLVPTALCLAGNLTGSWFAGMNTFFIIVVLGLGEWLLPESNKNSTEKQAVLPNFWLMLAVPCSFAVVGSLLYGVYTGVLHGGFMALAVVSTAFHTGAMGIVAAHEMIHRANPRWVQAGNFLLFLALNAYFFVDHLRVHHRYVGSLRDHATARYGEHFYAFAWRSIIGQWREALQLEAAACRKKGKRAYGWHNHLVQQSLLHLCLLSLLWLVGGAVLALAMLFQALLANILLEYTNYIEHYGLIRPENDRVTYASSWQSDKWFSRFLLYDLSRHSDHHVHGAKPYHELRSMADAPVLPGGYASLILPALIPPWWFRLMHAKVP